MDIKYISIDLRGENAGVRLYSRMRTENGSRRFYKVPLSSLPFKIEGIGDDEKTKFIEHFAKNVVKDKDGNVVKRDDDGFFYTDNEKDVILFKPNDMEAFVGTTVRGSATYDMDPSFVGVLSRTLVGKFTVNSYIVSFIKPIHPEWEPYDFNKKETRELMLADQIVSVDGDEHLMIWGFIKDLSGEWLINGTISAKRLLEKYRFTNGERCGVRR